jgi:thymidylate synthase
MANYLLMSNSPARSYRKMLSTLLEYGQNVAPRGQKTVELTDVTIEVTDPTNVLLTGMGRKLSTQLAALESLQLVGGFTDPELTVKVAPHYASFLDNDAFHGAYGSRTRHKIGLIIERLQQDPDSRQAVMTYWDDRYDLAWEGMHDYPCTVQQQFRIRHARLEMTTYMRSNDAWLGFPYDIVQFTTLQKTVAKYLKLPAGRYTHMVNSFHLYERDFAAAKELVKSTAVPDGLPWLTGGIGIGDELHWHDVQKRARRICYAPGTVVPQNDTEKWLVAQSTKWTSHLTPSPVS